MLSCWAHSQPFDVVNTTKNYMPRLSFHLAFPQSDLKKTPKNKTKQKTTTTTTTKTVKSVLKIPCVALHTTKYK